MKNFTKNPLIKNILSALIITIFGFILLNLTFLFDVLYQGAIRGLIGIFMPLSPDSNLYWFPPLMHLSFIFIIGIISLFVFKSKLKTIYKAIFLAVPLAVVLASIGMFFYQSPIAVYSLGALFSISVLCYFYRTKQPWLYYYTLILISLVLLISVLIGVEI